MLFSCYICAHVLHMHERTHTPVLAHMEAYVICTWYLYMAMKIIIPCHSIIEGKSKKELKQLTMSHPRAERATGLLAPAQEPVPTTMR